MACVSEDGRSAYSGPDRGGDLPEFLRPGTILSGCRVVSPVGRGGMGIVVKAIDQTLHRRVAIKFVHSHLADSKGQKRFLREAAAMAQCDHPGIARIYTCGAYQGQAYFVMEFLEGRTLDACLHLAVELRKSHGHGMSFHSDIETAQVDTSCCPRFPAGHSWTTGVGSPRSGMTRPKDSQVDASPRLPISTATSPGHSVRWPPTCLVTNP